MKKDVYKYYDQCVKQVISLNKSIEDIQKSYGDSEIDKERLKQISELASVVQENCNRLGYVMFLLKQPLFGKRNYMENNRDLLSFFKKKKIDEESIYNENEDILNKVRQFIKITEEEESDE